MARTGPKNPHRSGLSREPRAFSEPFTDMRVPKPEDLVPTIYVTTLAAARQRAEELGQRNAEAEAAWDAALAPSRLPLGHPDRVPYTETVKAALSAYDEVIERWRS